MPKQKQFVSIYERKGLCPYPSFYGEANTKDVAQYLGIVLGTVLFDFQDNFFRLCLEKNEVKEVGNKILEGLKNGKIRPEVIQRQLTEFATKAINETLNFKKCLKQASKEDLAGFLTRFSYLMTQVIALGDSICFLPEQQATNEFEKGLSQAVRSSKMTAQISPILLRFDKLSFVGREECELFQVIQSGNKANLKEHAKMWAHLAFDYTGPITKYGEFLRRYQKLRRQDLSKKLETCQNYEQKVKEEKLQIIKKYNISKEVVLLTKIISDTNFIYDLRKSFLTKMTYEFSFILDKVTEVCGVERQWVNWLLPQEVIALLEDKFKPTRAVIQNRQKDGLIVFQNGQGHWANEKEKTMYRDLIKKQIEINDVQEIKGKPASNGKAQGRVTRVIGPAHLNKMALGDVLVAPMTSVDYMPAIRLAAAIITDIGGLTSHAAVIARELQIPCIVGTKIATQVLKDGDIVEVDADKGIVKILK